MLSMRFRIICKLAADKNFAAGNSKSERAITLKKKSPNQKSKLRCMSSHHMKKICKISKESDETCRMRCRL